LLIQLIHALRPSSQVLRYQVEHFLLTPADLQLVVTCRGDANRYDIGAAVEGAGLLGFVPEKLDRIPGVVLSMKSRLPSNVGRSL